MKKLYYFSAFLFAPCFIKAQIMQNSSPGYTTATPGYNLYTQGNINNTGIVSNIAVTGQSLTNNVSSSNSSPTINTANTDTRFFYKSAIPGKSTATADSLPLSNTIYNTTNILKAANGKYITINKTGLYHFEAVVNGSLSTSPAQSNAPQMTLELRVNNNYLTQINNAYYQTGFSALPTSSWSGNFSFKQDMYITAGSTIALYRLNTNYPIGSWHYFTYHFSGYLISE